MKKFILSLFFLATIAACAQSEVYKKAVETFSLDYNNNDFEKIYQSFSLKMQKAHPKKYYFAFFSRIKKENGNLLFLELLEYQEFLPSQSRGTYNGNFDNDVLIVKISIDRQNKISGLYIKKKNII